MKRREFIWRSLTTQWGGVDWQSAGKTSGYTARRKDHGTKVWFDYSRREVFVTHYYFTFWT